MTYTIETPVNFLRQAGQFLQEHPGAREPFAAIIAALRDDPFQSHLALRPARDGPAHLWSARLTHGYRVTLSIEVERRAIVLLAISGHDAGG